MELFVIAQIATIFNETSGMGDSSLGGMLGDSRAHTIFLLYDLLCFIVKKYKEKLKVMDSTHEQVCYARTHIHHTCQRPNDIILTVHQE